jgi:hypothetical protein
MRKYFVCMEESVRKLLHLMLSRELKNLKTFPMMDFCAI